MNTFKKYLKNYKISIPIAIALLIGGYVVFAGGKTEVERDVIEVSRGTVFQEISVTGRVQPSNQVDLAVQSGGKVAAVTVKVGQNVSAGQTLLRVDSSDLSIRLGRQQADLEKARLALLKQEPGAGNATSDLTKAYEDAFNTVADTFLDLPSIITGLDSILNDWRNSPYMENEELRRLGTPVIDMKTDVNRNFAQTETLFDAALIKYKALNRSSPHSTIDAMLNDTYALTKRVADAVKNTRNLVDYIENQSSHVIYQSEIDADQTALDEYTGETNTHLTDLLTAQNEIKDSRDAIRDETNDTTSSRIDIRQAELDIQDTLVQIANRTIKSPVAGVVTKVEVRVGETISPSTPAISVISTNNYEIEANLPEADIAKLKVGAEADITLDAYGSDATFKAKVTAIDPAETLIDGVATYTTTFQFIQNDERIKSGMTANILVKGERRENVLSVPQRAVITKAGKKIVQVLEEEKVVEKEVKTGLRGSDGSIEVTEGLEVGDKVIVFTEK